MATAPRDSVAAANPSKEHRGASTPGKVMAVVLVGVATFQAVLALGAPWGAAAMGGANPGVLPDPLRASSAVFAVVCLALAAVAGTSWASVRLRSRLLYGTSASMILGTLMNIASPSFIERIIWTPVTIVLVLTAWRAARLDAEWATRRDGLEPQHA